MLIFRDGHFALDNQLVHFFLGRATNHVGNFNWLSVVLCVALRPCGLFSWVWLVCFCPLYPPHVWAVHVMEALQVYLVMLLGDPISQQSLWSFGSSNVSSLSSWFLGFKMRDCFVDASHGIWLHTSANWLIMILYSVLHLMQRIFIDDSKDYTSMWI